MSDIINIQLNKKFLFILAITIFLIISIGLVISIGSDNPEIHGHTQEEVKLPDSDIATKTWVTKNFLSK